VRKSREMTPRRAVVPAAGKLPRIHYISWGAATVAEAGSG
jgi:hypothetical protein